MTSWSDHVDAVRLALHDERRDRLIPRVSETAFLPAVLEVIERPVSPTARASAWVLMIGLVATIIWLVFGRIDVVATAQGKLIPTGNVKLIQSAGSGTVRAIYVQDGDRVRAGQPLLDMDPTLSGADLAQSQKALLSAELDVARNRSIANGLVGRGVDLAFAEQNSPRVIETQRSLVRAQLAEVEANVSSLQEARNSALADARAATAQIDRYSQTTPILDREIEAMNQLDAKGYAPGLRLLELQRQRRQEVGDRQVAVEQRAKNLDDAAKIARQIVDVRETARRTVLADLSKSEADAILRHEDVVKAERRNTLQRLVAPVAGTVQQLVLHTIGGVVEPAKTLMVIVPADSRLEVEARVLNKDAGFVHEGQPVSVKIDAFPFTRFGMVPGHLRGMSRDAVVDAKTGATYAARIALDRTGIDVDGRQALLTPGMTVAADIRTGKRRIVSYLLSPLKGTISQAGRER